MIVKFITLMCQRRLQRFFADADVIIPMTRISRADADERWTKMMAQLPQPAGNIRHIYRCVVWTQSCSFCTFQFHLNLLPTSSTLRHNISSLSSITYISIISQLQSPWSYPPPSVARHTLSVGSFSTADLSGSSNRRILLFFSVEEFMLLVWWMGMRWIWLIRFLVVMVSLCTWSEHTWIALHPRTQKIRIVVKAITSMEIPSEINTHLELRGFASSSVWNNSSSCHCFPATYQNILTIFSSFQY